MRGLSVLLWCTLWTSPGQAQTTAAESGRAPAETRTTADGQPSQDPPRAHADVRLPVVIDASVPPVELGPEHPPGESSVRVILELVIDDRGRVIRSTLLDGPEPYASTAQRASSQWRFEPATQDGLPTTAKIHFMVNFDAPPVLAGEGQTPPAGDDEAPPSTTSSPGSTSAVLEEVVVLGEVRHPTGRSITRMETNHLAGAFGDPLRAIESLPGVTPIASGLPLFFVRGAPPANVGYFFDGIRLPQLYHGFLGPSVIHPAFLREVTLHAGPMPAEFGRYAGAAVEAELAPAPTSRTAEASLRLIDAGAYAAAPFAADRGAVQLAGRYSYTALLISLFSPGTRLDYWDYLGRASYRVGRQDELSLLALGAYDYAGSADGVLGATEFHRIDARWVHDFSANDRFRLAATWGSERTRSEQGFVADRLLATRMNFQHASKDATFRAGSDLWVDRFRGEVDPGVSEPEIYQELFPTRTDVSGGIWTDVVIPVGERLRVIPGVRVDFFQSLGLGRVSIDPRLSAEYQLTPRVRAIHSLGVAHQTPNFVPNVPGAQVAGLEGGLQRSLQAATEYQAKLPGEITGSVAVFLNGTAGLTDPVGLNQNFSIDETSDDVRALGRAAGFELYLKRALTRRLGGLLSYTFSRTLRSTDRITTLSGYDRPHVVNAALTYELGWGVRASAKFAAASGIPGRRTSLDGFFFDGGSRSRPYLRLDAKLEKRFSSSPHFEWGVHAEVLNATNTGNVTTRACTVRGCQDQGTLPITFPSLGLDAVWK